MKLSLFQGILFGVFGIAALIGVFLFATYNGSNAGSNATSVGTVVVWGTLAKTDIQNVLTSIGKTNTDLKDVSYVQKDQNTLATDLASAIATGNAPDLILASQEVLLPLAKFLTPISFATLPASTFTTAFVQAGSVFATPAGDGYYGVPFLVDPLVLFSNRAILSSNGIVKPPATWEALTGLVPNIAQLTSTKQITRGLIALGSYDNVHNARAILSSLFLQTRIPIATYRNGVLVADLNNVTGSDTPQGSAVLNFYTQFADPSKVSYTWNASLPDSQREFQNGDLALYLGFASEARYFRAANPNLDFTVSALPQPGTSSVKSAYGHVYAFMIPRGAKNATGAYQAAALMSTAAIQPEAASILGIAPAALNALATVPGDPVAAVAYAEALYTKGWLSPIPADTDSVFSSMITNVISGRLAPDRALTTSENTLTALLQK